MPLELDESAIEEALINMSSSGMDKFAERVGSQTSAPRFLNSVGQSAGYPDTPAPDWASVSSAARCWSQAGDAFFPVTEIVNKLPAGAYRPQMSNRGPYLDKMPIQLDSLLNLPDSASEMLLAEFEQFWTLKENFAKRGFTYKRGILLWGPPGSGKTSAIWQMTQSLVKNHNGIVMFVEHPDLASTCLSLIRRIEPDRPLICIYEDIDALVHQHGDHGYLAMLDGETQTSNVVHVATTNYPEYLDKRFVDRPSRFDTIALIDMPGPAAREAYFKAKEKELDEVTLKRWVKKTDGYSVSHLREVIVAIKCFEQPEEEVFKRLDAMRVEKLASDGMGGKGRGKVGFSP